MPQPTCHWRTAESLPGKSDAPALERLNVTSKSMDLSTSPGTQHTSPPRPRTAHSTSLFHLGVLQSARADAHQCSYPLFLFWAKVILAEQELQANSHSSRISLPAIIMRQDNREPGSSLRG